MKFEIDIVSDVVCPWCFVGKKRLEKAIKKMDGETFELNIHPFQLNPDIKEDSILLEDYLVEKFGNLEKVRTAQQQLEAVALEEGINMDFSKIKFAHNTLKAHALMQSAKSSQEKMTLNNALLSAYFEQGKDIGKESVLLEIGQESQVDFDPNFAQEASLQAIRLSEQDMKKKGITAVPSFIINKRFLIQGAQPVSSFIKVFEQIKAQRN